MQLLSATSQAKSTRPANAYIQLSAAICTVLATQSVTPFQESEVLKIESLVSSLRNEIRSEAERKRETRQRIDAELRKLAEDKPADLGFVDEHVRSIEADPVKFIEDRVKFHKEALRVERIDAEIAVIVQENESLQNEVKSYTSEMETLLKRIDDLKLFEFSWDEWVMDPEASIEQADQHAELKYEHMKRKLRRAITKKEIDRNAVKIKKLNELKSAVPKQ
ncbi:hypothetical protein U8335_04300 [Roseiconus lacunae]|uniref:hypothetical protein n=1 Tax=Roseiconus lacunae TaxID=2605694 RepID=UPI0030890D9C|nr:hypothetical protein U8335_04300 [Stieleria sp. HD01]